MAMNAHMTIEGTKQGAITDGCCTMEGREGTTPIMRLEQVVEIPWNVQDGRAQGQRIHRPLRIVKAIDRSSPLICQAMTTNELLKITVQFYRPNPDGDGSDEQFYTVVLERANLINYKGELPFTLDEHTSRLPPMETMDIAFEKITTTITRDGREFVDDARKRNT